MTLIRETPWDACLLERRPDPVVASKLKREIGTAPQGAFYFGAVPWMPEAVSRLNICVLRRTHVDWELLDLIGLVVSQESSCRYCFASQRAVMIGLGNTPAHMDRLERDLLVAVTSDRDRIALEFARKVARANPLATPADREALLSAGFSVDEVREIMAYVALNVFFNRLSTMSALPPGIMETLPDRWAVRLLKPLITPRVRRMRKSQPPQALGPYDGPFAPVFHALDGLHTTQSLRHFVDQLWSSPIVTPRALALVCAVVSRALGCERGEAAALRMIEASGMASGDAHKILDHLTGSQLDDFERVALPFARETAWVQAAQVTRLQRLARDVKAQMSEAEFVTLLAMTSIANALCRVGATLPTD